MKLCVVPTDFVLDLGYRKVQIKAGTRHYPDEVADAYPMTELVVPDPDDPGTNGGGTSKPAPAPDPDEPEPKKGK
jgi:hypothetical protein